MTKVTCVGISVFDYIFEVEHLPKARIKHYARGRREATGGIAATAARTIVRLGGEASLVSRIGDDLPGRAIVAELEAEGVDTLGVHVLPQGRTSLSSVLIDATGERLVVNDTDLAILTGTDGVALTPFAGAAAVLADTRWADAATVAMQQAASLGVPGVLDFDRVPDAAGWEPLLELAPYILFGRQGLAHFTDCATIEDGLRAARLRTTAWLGATAGEDGVYWLDGEAVRHMPAFPVKAVDTLGAGDVFHAAFTLALAEEQPIEAALRLAGAAAALKCTRPGGGSGAPWAAELESFLEEHA